MRRREFIAFVAGAAALYASRSTRAQSADPMRRIGILMSLTADDRDSGVRLAAFLKALGELGWIEGRNLAIEIRWGADDAERLRQHADDLIALAPTVLLASGSSSASALRQATPSVPIVFVQVAEPHSLVDSFAQPGRNITGFASIENGISAQWLELLKEIAPGTTRCLVIRDPDSNAGTGQFAAIERAAPALRLDLRTVGVRDGASIERAIADVTREPNGGLVVTTSTRASAHRDLIVASAARHRVPAVYPFRFYADAGGLLAYGPDWTDQYRRAAGYVDRILKGGSPAGLPVQTPAKYELTINRKTAQALGLEIPPSLLARADAMIE